MNRRALLLLLLVALALAATPALALEESREVLARDGFRLRLLTGTLGELYQVGFGDGDGSQGLAIRVTGPSGDLQTHVLQVGADEILTEGASLFYFAPTDTAWAYYRATRASIHTVVRIVPFTVAQGFGEPIEVTGRPFGRKIGTSLVVASVAGGSTPRFDAHLAWSEEDGALFYSSVLLTSENEQASTGLVRLDEVFPDLLGGTDDGSAASVRLQPTADRRGALLLAQPAGRDQVAVLEVRAVDAKLAEIADTSADLIERAAQDESPIAEVADAIRTHIVRIGARSNATFVALLAAEAERAVNDRQATGSLVGLADEIRTHIVRIGARLGSGLGDENEDLVWIRMPWLDAAGIERSDIVLLRELAVFELPATDSEPRLVLGSDGRRMAVAYLDHAGVSTYRESRADGSWGEAIALLESSLETTVELLEHRLNYLPD